MAQNTALFQNAANMIKHAPTTARSSRLRVSLRSLATPWPAASLRFSPLYVTTGSLGSISFFLLIYRGSVRWRSLHHLPKSRRPYGAFKLGGHAPAVIHISVRLRLTRTFVVTHANAWGLRPYTRTLAVARANVRPNGLTRGAPNGAPNSDLSLSANRDNNHKL